MWESKLPANSNSLISYLYKWLWYSLEKYLEKNYFEWSANIRLTEAFIIIGATSSTARPKLISIELAGRVHVWVIFEFRHKPWLFISGRSPPRPSLRKENLSINASEQRCWEFKQHFYFGLGGTLAQTNPYSLHSSSFINQVFWDPLIFSTTQWQLASFFIW